MSLGLLSQDELVQCDCSYLSKARLRELARLGADAENTAQGVRSQTR